MAWGNDILVMLHSKTFLKTNSKKQIINTEQYLTPSFSLPVESIEKVNEIVESGLKAGGKEPNAMIEEGFMQVRTIEDLDGYSWGIICLDIDKFKEMNNRQRTINQTDQRFHRKPKGCKWDKKNDKKYDTTNSKKEQNEKTNNVERDYP